MNDAIINRIKKLVSDKLGDGFDEETFNATQKLLQPSLCKVLAVRLDYFEQKAKTDKDSTQIIRELADLYNISEASAHNSVYRKRYRELDKLFEQISELII